MKIKIRVLLVLFIYLSLGVGCGEAFSQNIVPNGDFEYYNSCPTFSSQIYRATPWYDPNGATPDYFNACALASSYASVPVQDPGSFQYAHSGVGYAGLFAMQYSGGQYREYIQVQLSDTLSNQKCYSVSFYVSLYNIVKYGCNNLGAYISQTTVTSVPPNPIPVTPQILRQGNLPIIDTLNWTKISGVYQATGGEKYVTIGNFNYDSTTVTQIINISSPFNVAYYYVDDVSLYEIKTSSAGRDTTICEGDSLQLGTNNYEGVTYSWQPTTGLSNANIGNPMASPSTATTYYLTQTTPCAVTLDTVVVSVCGIGINEYSNLKNNFKLYPNPNDGNMTLEYNINGSASGVFTIYDVSGRIVKQQSLASENKTIIINANELNAGTYYFTIRVNDKIVKTEKLVIIK